MDWPRPAPRATDGLRSSISLTTRSTAALADPKIRARLAELGGTVLLAGLRAPTLANTSLIETEKWGKCVRFREHQAGVIGRPRSVHSDTRTPRVRFGSRATKTYSEYKESSCPPYSEHSRWDRRFSALRANKATSPDTSTPSSKSSCQRRCAEVRDRSAHLGTAGVLFHSVRRTSRPSDCPCQRGLLRRFPTRAQLFSLSYLF